MQRNFKLRSKVNLLARNFLDKEGFLDIETPMLTNATPEGARDYLVPSRIYKGKMFALPQSPQQFKQLLMVSGFERYFQITRCFRDEDLRADRQPEFTQIDIEMSFAEHDELFAIIERLVREIFALRGHDVALPFRRLPYQEAMEKYGSDKPDLRIPYTIEDFTAEAGAWNSDLLNAALAEGAKVKGLVIPDAGSFLAQAARRDQRDGEKARRQGGHLDEEGRRRLQVLAEDRPDGHRRLLSKNGRSIPAPWCCWSPTPSPRPCSWPASCASIWARSSRTRNGWSSSG